MALSERLARAQEILGHEFNNKVLLRAALTHPSAVEGQPVSASYERLEFLGDSILGAVVARSLFESYPEFDEGKLTRLKVSLVSGATLSEVSHELGIDDIIIFGASETGTGARGLHSALENVYESLVGALYLDAGWDVAAEFIHRTLKPHLASERAEHPANPKSFCRSACRPMATSLRRTSSLALRARRTHRPLPPWCSSTVSARAAAPVPPRRKQRELPRSRRSTAWATPPMV